VGDVELIDRSLWLLDPGKIFGLGDQLDDCSLSKWSSPEVPG
jgi:hypothetical protein